MSSVKEVIQKESFKKTSFIPKSLRRSPNLYVHATVWWVIFGLFYISIEESMTYRAIHFVLGAFAQSFFEYVSHRWAFHGPLWQMHRGHHLRPAETSRLLVPFMYSVPCGAVEFLFVGLIVGLRTVCALSLGAAFWYILFEWIHYSSHRPELQWLVLCIPFYKDLRHMHRVHHYERDATVNSPTEGYTYYEFTTVFWYKIFRTC